MTRVVSRLPRVGDAQEYRLSDGSFRKLSGAFLARTDIDLDDFAAVGRAMGLERKTMAEDNLKNFRDLQDQMAEINKAALSDKVDPFDLARCMKDGGKCLIIKAATDETSPARLALTDVVRGGQKKLLVLSAAPGRTDEMMFIFNPDGSGHSGPYVLRNLPEYKEVEVTLWHNPHIEAPASCWLVSLNKPGPVIGETWEKYGPPVKVRFER